MKAFALALLLAPAATSAADRDFPIGSFDRLRVDGPFEVQVTTGGGASVRATGDRRLLDALDIELQGDTLVVRMGPSGWGEAPASDGGPPPVILLATPHLDSVAVNAGGRVSIGHVESQRFDVAVNGAGAVTVGEAATDELNATVIGAGQLTLAGRSNRARLLTNGPGVIDAVALKVSDLTVRLDGTGETRAAATYTAQVTTTGLGRVSVAGNAKCAVHAIAGGPVECGPKL